MAGANHVNFVELDGHYAIEVAPGAGGGGGGGVGLLGLLWCVWRCPAPPVHFDNWVSEDGASAVSVSRSEPVDLDDLDAIGEPAGAKTREAPGGKKAAEAIWEGWKRKPGVKVERLPRGNGWKATDREGNVVVYRPKSGSGDPAIDYKRKGEKRNTKIHFGNG